MPALTPTDHYGTVTWLGRVPDRAASLRAEPLTEAMLTFAGIEGEAHGGLTRPCCGRFIDQHPKGTEIRNSRQLSVLSAEDLAGIAAEMGVDELNPGWIGASLVLSGLPDLSHLPPASRLQSDQGTTLTVDLENGPCHLPAKVIDEDAPGHGRRFKAAAQDRRGVTAWVERPGPLKIGDRMRLHIPTQRPWAGA